MVQIQLLNTSKARGFGVQGQNKREMKRGIEKKMKKDGLCGTRKRGRGTRGFVKKTESERANKVPV